MDCIWDSFRPVNPGGRFGRANILATAPPTALQFHTLRQNSGCPMATPIQTQAAAEAGNQGECKFGIGSGSWSRESDKEKTLGNLQVTRENFRVRLSFNQLVGRSNRPRPTIYTPISP